jgi:hypothetical protein
VLCKYKPCQSKSEQSRNPCWRASSVLLALIVRTRLVLLDVLKNWIDTSKFLNFVTRGLRRLTLALGLAFQDERCGDGCAMAPFQKRDVDEDDPASSIPMSAMCSTGGKKETAMGDSFIEN